MNIQLTISVDDLHTLNPFGTKAFLSMPDVTQQIEQEARTGNDIKLATPPLSLQYVDGVLELVF